MSDLSQQDWISNLNSDSKSIILDVRTDAEVEEGMIPEAKHLDIHQGQDFISALEKLDKTNSYYVYCRSGARSGQACSIMQQMGFEKAYNLLGGFNDWKGETIIP
ncbi:MAG: rhodanese-like domain-containing protein [Flavobacteriaceae bacterium]|jgi:rhodanese-related sulfurtransferase|nr:rhodanese-like domain-containing protein [Flavobacteriaceae bacterium]